MPIATGEITIHPRDRDSILFKMSFGGEDFVHAVQLKADVSIPDVCGNLRPAMGDGYRPREQNDTVMVISSR
jgi:hypothetical protein